MRFTPQEISIGRAISQVMGRMLFAKGIMSANERPGEAVSLEFSLVVLLFPPEGEIPFDGNNVDDKKDNKIPPALACIYDTSSFITASCLLHSIRTRSLSILNLSRGVSV